MQRSLSIVLLFSLLLSLVSASLVVLRFNIDQERIIRELCVQRELPPEQNTCKGQCHMKKQLRQAEPNDADESMPEELRSPEIKVDLSEPVRVPSETLVCCQQRISHSYPTLRGVRSESDGVPWS